MEKTNLSRRNFFARAAVGAVVTTVAFFGRRYAPVFAADTAMVDLKDPLAVAMGYVVDGSKVDTAKYPKKADPKNKSQSCANCALYVAKGAAKGTCTLFQNKGVPAIGWCNGWAPKA